MGNYNYRNDYWEDGQSQEDFEKFAEWYDRQAHQPEPIDTKPGNLLEALKQNTEIALDILLEHSREELQGMFKRRYNLRGRDWLRSIPAEDRVNFAKIGGSYADYGYAGGIARARSAKRDRKGRFTHD